MGQARRFLPLQRGFDFFYGHGNNGIDYFTHERYGVPSMFRGNERTEEDKGTYATDLFGREAIRFIRGSPDRPWFLYLAFNAPHSASSFAKEADPRGGVTGGVRRVRTEGVQAPEEFVAPYRDKVKDENLARYYGAVACMDAAIGAVTKAIEDAGQIDNTLILFLSDNGGEGGGGNGGNAPLRGRKGTMYEGGLRVPFLASWPGRLPEGRVTDEFLTSLEIFPTLAGIAGVEPDPAAKLDGFDMLPVLRGERPSPRAEMFWQRRDSRAARVGRWKWVDGPAGGLFDLTADIGETSDLSKEKPDVAAKLKSRHEAWRREMDSCEPRGPFRDY
ncbi:MAG: hypothetical protein BWK77_05795 [Verrucomicrobia bacterium A1]|nr:MAG: hypothetical protein BWK77_05795 [Verrucomicrobia bacterium A1]